MNDLPIFFYSTPGEAPDSLYTPERREQLAAMRDAGVHGYDIQWSLQSGWTAPGVYDYRTLDEALDYIAQTDPQCRLLLRLSLNAPAFWYERWPEDAVAYALSETHDTTQTSDLAMDKGPLRISLASARWRRETIKAIKSLVKHLRESENGRRVFGITCANCTFGEWHYWGFFHLPDMSAAMDAHFRRWVQRRYGALEEASRAWSMPLESWDDVRVPGLERQDNTPATFREGPHAARTLDYARCHQGLVADSLLACCRAVKQASEGKVLAGAFYGYFFNTPWRDEGGHLEYRRVVRSKWVDFLAGPQAYDIRCRDIGGTGLDRGLVADVLANGKIWLSEADTPTHLGRLMAYFWRTPDEIAKTPADSIALVRRDAARAFTQGNRFWWYDFGRKFTGGEYLDEEIMADIAQLVRLSHEVEKLDRSPIAQAALAYDPESCYQMSHWRASTDSVSSGAIEQLVVEAQYIGAPVDLLCRENVQPRHRLAVVANAYHLSPVERRKLCKTLCRDGRTVLWLYAPGALGGGGMEDGITATTGMRVRQLPEPAESVISFTGSSFLPEDLHGTDFRYAAEPVWMEKYDPIPAPAQLQPAFYIDDPAAEPLAYWFTGQIASAVKREPWGTSIYCALPMVPRQLLRHLLQQAGGHIYCESEDVWLANRSVLAVHTRDGGPRTVRLPEAATVINGHTGEVAARKATAFDVDLPPRSTTIFLLEHGG
jgi:beta-galactosidase